MAREKYAFCLIQSGVNYTIVFKSGNTDAKNRKFWSETLNKIVLASDCTCIRLYMHQMVHASDGVHIKSSMHQMVHNLHQINMH